MQCKVVLENVLSNAYQVTIRKLNGRESEHYPGHELTTSVVIKKIFTAHNMLISLHYYFFCLTMLLRKSMSEIIAWVMPFGCGQFFSCNRIN